MKTPREYAQEALQNWRNDAETKISQDGVLVIATEAVTKAIADAIKAAGECAVCRRPIGPAVWCSIACMEKHIGPTCAAGAMLTGTLRNDVAATTMPCPVGCGGAVQVDSSTCERCGASINVQRIT